MTVQTTRTISLGIVNVFLLQAQDGYLLLDTGMPQAWPRLEQALLEAGCLPGRLKLVILTHGDVDHIGNCPALQQKYGVRVAMHAGDAPMVQSGQSVKRQARGLLNKLMLRVGERMGSEPVTFQPDIFLQDGQSLAEYGLAAMVLHIPGHTPGSIAVLTSQGDLFVGDTYTNYLRPASASLVNDATALRSSLARLKQVEARRVFPGHGRPFPYAALLALRTER